jgi:P-type Cu+ transporter
MSPATHSTADHKRDKMKTVTLAIEGMTCGKCVARVDEALREVAGVDAVEVVLEPGSARVQAEGSVALSALIEAVEDAGYDAHEDTAPAPAAPAVEAPVEEPVVEDAPPGSARYAVRVGGMTCASCVARVERALGELEEIKYARVNFATETAYVDLKPGESWDEARVREAVDGAGYEVVSVEAPQAEGASAAPAKQARAERASDRRDDEAAQWRARFGVGLALTAPIMALQMGPMWMGWSLPHDVHVGSQWVAAYLTALVMGVVGRPFFVSAYKAARHGSATMDTLVALGSGVAFVASLGLLIAQTAGAIGHLGHENVYFDGAAMILGLISLGKWMEARAKGGASRALEALLEVAAARAWVERGGAWVEVAAGEVVVGDRMRVLPGEKIPTDGEIVEGEGDINEAMVTGESAPVHRGVGEQVLGGTINADGRLVVEAKRVGSETALAQIMTQLERAQASRASIQRLADRISAVFVPVVMAIALVTCAVWWAVTGSLLAGLLPAIAVLVVACPCALGLATPTALMVGTGRGSQEGILIQEADAMERASQLDVVMFDKTGTLTTGEMAVEAVIVDDVVSGGLLEEREVLTIAAALETGGAHPIASAIVARAEALGVAVSAADGLKTVAGQGVEGRLQGNVWRVGRPGWVYAGELPAEVTAALESGATVVGVAQGEEVRGWIVARDEVKPEAKEALAALSARGVEVWMVTGDARGAALRVASQLGIEEARVVSEVRPEEKSARVQAMREGGRVVAFVGDGINDAPALAAADLGIALGTGADVALEAAQIALVSGSLWQVVSALDLAVRVYNKIRQNLAWAFIYNAVLIPVAALGWLTPTLAAGAMAMSSVSVVANALLLRRWQPSGPARG